MSMANERRWLAALLCGTGAGQPTRARQRTSRPVRHVDDLGPDLHS
jgi:hypothetical protein